MASLPQNFDTSFWDKTVTPAIVAAGYQLSTYVTGTSTPALTYTNAALTIPNTNPIILDSEGRCNLYLIPSVTYALQLNKPISFGGGLVRRWESVTSQDLASDALGAELASTTDPDKGAAMIGYKLSAIGSVARSLTQVLGETLSVTQFGASEANVDNGIAFNLCTTECLKRGALMTAPCGNYKFVTPWVTKEAGNFLGGLRFEGLGAFNSVGKRVNLMQTDVNVPIIAMDSINNVMGNFAVTCWAGDIKTPAGVAIVVTATTPNTMTLSANPWAGSSPKIWAQNTPYPATDTTTYANAIRFTVRGAWICSAVTINGDGTVTLTNVRGAEGTLNGSLAATVGGPVESFISLAHRLPDAALTNVTNGCIHKAINENQTFYNVWFNQVARPFTHSVAGSGAGAGVGIGNAGFLSNIFVDQAKTFIYSPGTIAGLQCNNVQLYGVSQAFFAANMWSNSFTNLQLINSKLGTISGLLYDTHFGAGCKFNSGDAQGYSDNLLVVGSILSCTITGVTFGRALAQQINVLGDCDGLTFVGNNCESWGESTGSTGFFQFAGACKNSAIQANNFSFQYSATSPKMLWFTNTNADITRLVLDDNTALQTNHSKLGWILVTSFLNGWTNTAMGSASVAYFKDAARRVHIKGAASGGTPATAIFNLPVGFRPTNTIRFPGINSGVFAELDVQSGGNIISAGGNTWVDITQSFSTV